MMHYLYDTFAYIMFWFIGGAFNENNNNHIPDATTSSNQESVPSPVHCPRSNQQHEYNQQSLELSCVHMEKDNRTNDSRSKVTSQKEINIKRESSSNIVTNNKTEESDYANIDNSNNDCGDINKRTNAPEGSYADYLTKCDEITKIDHIYMFPSDDEQTILSDDEQSILSDDEQSIFSDDSVLEPFPLKQQNRPIEEFQKPDFPILNDIKPTTDLDLALKAGPMPRLCTYCFRWEDQPDDKYEEKDMVSDKWFMIGNVVFFRKLKPFWAQCSACGFGMSRKDVRGRKINRVKKLLCKMSGREYKGYEFKRFGYEWMSEEGRNKRLSACM